MKLPFLVPLLLLVVIPMTGQVAHTPTPEQCTADADAWGIPNSGLFATNEDQFSVLASTMMRDRTVTAKMLEARTTELGQCVEGLKPSRYAQANRAYTIAELVRMKNFMQRHNLMLQFYDEDAQGKRLRED
jgi:hypothetical protein